jgi:diketogulonate reductase-like aldo/keto reductase
MKRRKFLESLALVFWGSRLSLGLSDAFAKTKSSQISSNDKQRRSLKKPIPASSELLPVIGMGTWITFNVGEQKTVRDQRTKVLKAFFEQGGGLIDSSPMYGSSEEVLGYALQKLGYPTELFSATKIWTRNPEEGPKQLKASLDKWGVKKLDLEQVHNLLSWKEHLDFMEKQKEKGVIRYTGITTSHGRRHQDVIKIMKSRPIDFIQVTYNIVDREVEKDILPLAQEKNIAVIANRPFRGGGLVKGLKSSKKPLPTWAKDIQCENWPQFLLKFIVSHPAVTCAIPATSKVHHMNENMGARLGELPDSKTRKKMLSWLQQTL